MFKKLFLVVALLAAVLVGGPALAGKLTGENLLTPLPSGFKLGFSQGGDFMEYVPEGETVRDWSQMLTVSVYRGKSLDPDEYSKNLAAGWSKACPGGEATKVTSGTENHYAFALWLYACPLNPETGKPETMTMKSIRGADSFYIVQYAHRKAADQTTVTPEAKYLRGVMVCDTRKSDRQCPSGM